MTLKLCILTLLGAGGATVALAATPATTVSDLNLRAAPGPEADILATIPNQGDVTLAGCLDASTWCEVTYEGAHGWVDGTFLAASLDGQPLIVIENRDLLDIATVTHGGARAEAADIGMEAAVGLINPHEETLRYMLETPVEPVELEGEVVVGMKIPQHVVLQEVPHAGYSYAYVNGLPVLVDPGDRRIVFIVR